MENPKRLRTLGEYMEVAEATVQAEFSDLPLLPFSNGQPLTDSLVKLHSYAFDRAWLILLHLRDSRLSLRLSDCHLFHPRGPAAWAQLTWALRAYPNNPVQRNVIIAQTR
jgi:hypothetical protein